jgi:hypothetical protein
LDSLQLGYLGIGCMRGVIWDDMIVYGNERDIPLRFGAIAGLSCRLLLFA